MPKKKAENVLGLPQLPPPTSLINNSSLALFEGASALTPRETSIKENLHEQELIIDAIGVKTKFGIETMNGVKWQAAGDVLVTLQHVDENKQEAQGTGYQGAFDEFCLHLSTLACRHTLGAVEVSAGKIAEEINRSLYPPPEKVVLAPPPAKRGFLTRLFGD